MFPLIERYFHAIFFFSLHPFQKLSWYLAHLIPIIAISSNITASFFKWQQRINHKYPDIVYYEYDGPNEYGAKVLHFRVKFIWMTMWIAHDRATTVEMLSAIIHGEWHGWVRLIAYSTFLLVNDNRISVHSIGI